MNNPVPDDTDPVILPSVAPIMPRAGGLTLNPADGDFQYYTNLDLKTHAGKSRLINAMSPSDLGFDEDGCCYFCAVQYVIYPDQSEDPETGEISRFTRTVLISADGRTFRTSSEGAPRKLKAALALWSPEDWAGGIPFVITERRSRKTGRTYHDLKVVE